MGFLIIFKIKKSFVQENTIKSNTVKIISIKILFKKIMLNMKNRIKTIYSKLNLHFKTGFKLVCAKEADLKSHHCSLKFLLKHQSDSSLSKMFNDIYFKTFDKFLKYISLLLKKILTIF